MGSKSQRKGRTGELELVKILNDYGIPVQAGAAVSFGTTPDLIGMYGIHIECKRSEHLNLYNAVAQSVKDSEKFRDGLPAVFHRKNRTPWLVTMQLDDWMEIYQQALSAEEK